MRTLFTLALIAFAAPDASACEARQLGAELEAASPVAVPKAFLALAACDAEAARSVAADAFARTLPGEDATRAAIAALRAEAADVVAAWIRGLPADQRAATIDAIGRQCAAEPAVSPFFVGLRATEGDAYWTDRWYRGLATCRTAPARAILAEAVTDRALQVWMANDPALFFAVLEVYARNLGADAVPRLETLVGRVERPQKLLVIGAFADAANVGDPAGIDRPAATAVAAALERLGPTLRDEEIDRARDTLLAIGADAQARSFARYRWRDRQQDGAYTYLAVTQELVACRSGQRRAVLHHGELREAGDRWPEELQTSLVDTVRAHWKLGASCKGEAQYLYAMTEEPVADPAAARAWLDAQRAAFAARTAGYDEVKEVAQAPATW